MSKLYSVIYIFGVLLLLRINCSDAADVKYYNYSAQYPVQSSELPYESTESAFWARGTPCTKENGQFTCCTSFSIRNNPLVPVCTKFVKIDAQEWSLDLIMNNSPPSPIVQYTNSKERRECESVTNHPDDLFCVSWSTLEQTKIYVTFTITLGPWTYELYFDEINYEIDPKFPQPIEINPSVEYYLKDSETPLPYNEPEPGEVLPWVNGGSCHRACCIDYKGPGINIWGQYCVILRRGSPQDWYFTERYLSLNGYRSPSHDLGTNPNGRTCFFISDNTIDKFCVRFKSDLHTRTDVSLETTIGKWTYEVRFNTYDFKFDRYIETNSRRREPSRNYYHYSK